jgi:hypothetical protein
VWRQHLARARMSGWVRKQDGCTALGRAESRRRHGVRRGGFEDPLHPVIHHEHKIDLHTSQPRGPMPAPMPAPTPAVHYTPDPCPACAPRETLFALPRARSLSANVCLQCIVASRDICPTSAVLSTCFLLPVVLVTLCVAFASHVRSLLSLRCCVM